MKCTPSSHVDLIPHIVRLHCTIMAAEQSGSSEQQSGASSKPAQLAAIQVAPQVDIFDLLAQSDERADVGAPLSS